LIRRLAVVLPLLAALVLGLAACGGDDQGSGAGSDPTALLRDTFGADHPLRSGRLDADLDVDLKGVAQLQQPLNLHLGGPFQSNGGGRLPDFALDVDFEGGSRPITVGAVFAQGGGYLTVEGQAFDLGRQLYDAFKKGYLQAKADADAKQDAGRAPSTLAALGIEPLHWLTDPRNAGTEDIGGTQAVHIASRVDVDALLDDVSTLLARAKGVASSSGASVPTQLTARQREQIAKAITVAKVDVWTGAQDHTLRKVAVDVRLTNGRVTFQLTLAQLNRRQTIKPPGDARPLTELRTALGQLGLLGGGASSATPSTTAAPSATTTTATPPAASGGQADYADCLNAAGEDLAAVQECAKYLT
jgi:hypothetical protein